MQIWRGYKFCARTPRLWREVIPGWIQYREAITEPRAFSNVFILSCVSALFNLWYTVTYMLLFTAYVQACRELRQMTIIIIERTYEKSNLHSKLVYHTSVIQALIERKNTNTSKPWRSEYYIYISDKCILYFTGRASAYCVRSVRSVVEWLQRMNPTPTSPIQSLIRQINLAGRSEII